MAAKVDIAIAASLAALGVLEVLVLGSVSAPAVPAAPLTAVALLALALRRRVPGPAVAVTLAVLAVLQWTVDEPALGMAAFLGMLLGVGTAADRLAGRPAAVWLPLSAALLAAAVAGDPGADAGDVVYAGMMWGLACAVGRGVRARRLRGEALSARAEAAEQDREAAARRAVEDERARVARELHDVVAHGLSVIHVQARVARRYVDRGDAPAAREALDAVERVAHEALADMRRMLEVLRVSGDDQGPQEPQPGVADLEALVERARAAGVDAHLRVEGAPMPLPSGLDLTVYRLAQEALTNVLKHAGRARTEIVLRFAGADVVVEVVNGPGDGRPGVADGAGHGLLGMRERAALYGGELVAGPDPHGGFAIRARLPVEAA